MPSILSTLRVAAVLLLLGTAVACKQTPEDNTITPPEFTVEKFNSIEVGDDWANVTDKIGQPFGYYEVPKNKKRYVFSKPRDKKNKYAAYDVVAGADGKVVDKSIMRLYQD